MSRGWTKVSPTMLLPHPPIFRYPLPDRTLPVVVLVVSLTFRRPSSRYFPFVGFPDGDTKCPSVISYRAVEPCPRPLPSSNFSKHVCDALTLTLTHLVSLFVCSGN